MEAKYPVGGNVSISETLRHDFKLTNVLVVVVVLTYLDEDELFLKALLLELFEDLLGTLGQGRSALYSSSEHSESSQQNVLLL